MISRGTAMTQQYPPPYQPYQHHYGGPPSYRPQPSNGIGTGGFVVALIGAVLSLVPFLGIVSWVISPVGLVLSIVGLTAATRKNGAGRGLAIAGVVLGGVGLLICMLWAIGFAGAMEESRTGTSTYTAPSSSAPSSSAPSSSASAPTTAAAPAGSFTAGTYTVGSEIAPGRYRTAGAPADDIFRYCSATRESTDGATIGSPETTSGGPAYVTVRPGDGQVEFSGDCVWSPAS
ncbi:hypothetical protein PHK61_07965 [Actinomycetospora lutea]|uniref:hypothetical protein n=1 Tax=Actinomycetospora lutea TaxID=663604 RepID=UPI002366C845|nr:hypothetical protein [Actinomycetospora lutea]MDD7938352.1 hypothetical protein [Actinomycetospora lutea]